jgi:predicted DNA-binding WGR domain protein
MILYHTIQKQGFRFILQFVVSFVVGFAVITYYLTRINAELNERRYYLVSVCPSLLGEHSVLREWGRIGGHRRRMEPVPFSTEDEALQYAVQLVQRKCKRGYIERKEA